MSRRDSKQPPEATEKGELFSRAQPGYYPGFSTLAQQDFWDEATRKTVQARLDPPPPQRFFSADEVPLLQAVIERVLPQDDRLPERRIPILAEIDHRLFENRINGFRYEDMPPDREAYRLGLKAIDEMAHERFQAPFTGIDTFAQELLLKTLNEGKPDPMHRVWRRMPAHRFWALLLDDCIEAYYSHPWSWDEIGFGGPAYPRGYMRLEGGLPEPWEVDEQRYFWEPPSGTLSDLDFEREADWEQDAEHGRKGIH
jgi:Gluconate 2-dehydrogenase subunit 3